MLPRRTSNSANKRRKKPSASHHEQAILEVPSLCVHIQTCPANDKLLHVKDCIVVSSVFRHRSTVPVKFCCNLTVYCISLKNLSFLFK